MPLTRDTYCSFCGHAYTSPLVYPRTCAQCTTTVLANPIPVAVLLVPVVQGSRTLHEYTPTASLGHRPAVQCLPDWTDAHPEESNDDNIRLCWRGRLGWERSRKM